MTAVLARHRLPGQLEHLLARLAPRVRGPARRGATGRAAPVRVQPLDPGQPGAGPGMTTVSSTTASSRASRLCTSGGTTSRSPERPSQLVSPRWHPALSGALARRGARDGDLPASRRSRVPRTCFRHWRRVGSRLTTGVPAEPHGLHAGDVPVGSTCRVGGPRLAGSSAAAREAGRRPRSPVTKETLGSRRPCARNRRRCRAICWRAWRWRRSCAAGDLCRGGGPATRAHPQRAVIALVTPSRAAPDRAAEPPGRGSRTRTDGPSPPDCGPVVPARRHRAGER
jgi:hypothetical protein